MTFADPLPFEEAWLIAKAKGLLPTTLPSWRLRELRAQLKRRAVFSARLTILSALQAISDNVALIVGGVKDEHDRYRSIPEAKAQLLESLKASGYEPEPGEEGTIKDHLSDERLQLIVETSVLDTLGAGKHEAGMSEVALDVNPAWELVRMIQSRVPRDWRARWVAAGGRIYGGRMIALKTSLVWQALGDGVGGYDDTLGNAWPPFAFRSGMNRVSVSRKECERLGLLAKGEKVVRPPGGAKDLNEGVEASAKRYDEELAKAVAADGGIELQDGVLRVAMNSRVYRRDHLGRFAADGGPLTVSQNIKRGSAAIDEALRNERDVPNAMNVRRLGRIDFEWGRGGAPEPDSRGVTHRDGYGISHVLAKRGEAATRRIPEILAKGRILRHEEADKRIIQHDHWSVIVQKRNASQSYVVTNIDALIYAKNSRLPVSLWHPVNRLRTKVGTGAEHPCPTHTTQLFAESDVVASNAVRVEQVRDRVKQFLVAVDSHQEVAS